MRVLALDLEGTLISNAVSVFARPGLFEFLESCNDCFDRIVVMTAVSEKRFRGIARLLIEDGSAPSWFADIDYIIWTGEYKDLSAIGGCRIEEVVLVDDQRSYVHPDQMAQWMAVAEYESPYSRGDGELADLWHRLAQRVNCGNGDRGRDENSVL